MLPDFAKDELIDFSIRTGAPAEVTENLQELEDDGAPYESIEEISTELFIHNFNRYIFRRDSGGKRASGL